MLNKSYEMVLKEVNDKRFNLVKDIVTEIFK